MIPSIEIKKTKCALSGKKNTPTNTRGRLGSADEQKPAKEGTVEEWGRSPKNPVGGWYALKKGLRGRFGMYIPPLMEKLGLAELTHEAKGNRMKAK